MNDFTRQWAHFSRRARPTIGNSRLRALMLTLLALISLGAQSGAQLRAQDTTGPTVRVTAPVASSTSRQISTIAGTAFDNAGGSGVSSVTTSLFRNADRKWWSGTTWVDNIVLLATNFNASNGNWTINAPLPTGSNLQDGLYVAIGSAIDRSNNTGTGDSAFFIDKTPPGQLAFINPTNGQLVNNLSNINGTVDDNSGGSGIASVLVTIQRVSDSRYWNGSAFVSSAFEISAQAGGGNWSLSTSLVAGNDPNTTLTNGDYKITATARDKADNASTNNITVTSLNDFTAPTVAWTNPTANSAQLSLPTLSGTAQDNPGGSGLGGAQLALLRNSDQFWWNGTTWQPNFVFLPAALNGNIFNNTGALPTGANLQIGAYVAIAYITDRLGNRGEQDVFFEIDKIAPNAPTVTRPSDGQLLNNLQVIEGRATDNDGGSGIGVVDVAIQRQSDNLYWNGNAFAPGPINLTAQSGGGFWSLTTTLRAGDNLPDGAYNLTASARDKAGNSTATTIAVQVIADALAPTINWTNPTQGQIIQSLPTLSGTTQDNAGGSGLASAQLALLRTSDQFWWNGSGWQPDFAFLPAVLNGNNFSNAGALPADANLQNGGYVAIAYILDRIGNRGEQDVAFSVGTAPPAQDTAPPTIAITRPTINSFVSQIAPIAGTASDNAGGSGLERVSLGLNRVADNTWWNGSAWTPTFIELRTALSGTNWVLDSGLPQGSDLNDGAYFVLAIATDRSGNRGQTQNAFNVDVTSPNEPTFTQPTDGQFVTDLLNITGKAADTSGGSGVTNVDIAIRRLSDGLYWNGTAFVAGPVNLAAQSGNGLWSLQTSLRAGVNLADGSYQLTATSHDAAGNLSNGSITVRVLNDAIAPTIQWTFPVAGQTSQALPELRGLTQDNEGGSGLAKAQVALLRNSDKAWWNGSGWQPDFAFLNATLSGNTYARVGGLPTGTNLTNGTYVAIAYVYDRVGNRGEKDVTFSVGPPPPPPDTVAPTVTITRPTISQAVRSVTPAIGTAQDNNGGTGLLGVEVALYRIADNTYWNGRAFAPGIKRFRAAQSGEQWLVGAALPNGRQLTSGQYVLIAFARDRSGNEGQTQSTFSVDITPPALATFETPDGTTPVNNLVEINGRVADNDGGSGVVGVDLYIQRFDRAYWNGSAWTAALTPLKARVTGNFWEVRTTLDTGANLPSGNYLMTALSFDQAGNRSGRSQRFVRVISDALPPLVKWTAPASNAAFRSFPSLQGEAKDNPDGEASGLARVEIGILRPRDNAWWNGSSWQAQFATLPATVQGEKWQLSTNLPPDSALQPQRYVTIAYAYDKIGLQGKADISFLIDTIAPLAPQFSNPTNGSQVVTLAPITGRAIDAPNPEATGSGIGAVDVVIQRLSDNFTWNGSEWTREIHYLPTNLNNASFRRDGTPGGINLQSGDYRLTARATDRAGNTSQNAITVRVIDGQSPNIAIVSPGNNELLGALTTISGTTSGTNDTPNDTVRVGISIQRDSDGLYWNGSTYAPAPTLLPTTLAANGTWTFNGVPKGTNLPSGTYTIRATAFDASGNQSQSAIKVRISNDTIAPTLTLTDPKAGVTVRQLERVAGTATDETNGSGLVRVGVAILRQRDQLWWNGAKWTDQFFLLPATISGINWAVTSNLPRTADTPAGGYLVIAQAYDKVGNTSQQEVIIGIDANGPVQGASQTQNAAVSLVKLSTWKADGAKVQLFFTGALDVDSATDVDNYRVAVGGSIQSVESASYSSNVVTLTLKQNVSSDTEISWQLQDAANRILSGHLTH